MAIYLLKFRNIKRNSGNSIVGLSAYISGTRIRNEYDGTLHNHSSKEWIVFSEVMLSKHAPTEYEDRATLWNSIELLENSKAQLGYEIILSLPKEMCIEQHKELVHTFIFTNFVSKGFVADVSIHNPPRTDDLKRPIDRNGFPTNEIDKMDFSNPHCHILISPRTIGQDGKWKAKSQKVYICKRDNIEKAFSSTEFNIYKNSGWEKQYQYFLDDKKVWLTPSEAKEQNLERVNKSPKSQKYGDKSYKANYINSRDKMIALRQSWQDIVNDKFIELESDIRIHAHANKGQGILLEEPYINISKEAIYIDRRAERLARENSNIENIAISEQGTINAEIQKHNELIQKIKKNAKSFAEYLEKIRKNLILQYYQLSTFKSAIARRKAKVDLAADRLTKSVISDEEMTDHKANISAFKYISDTVDRIQKNISYLLNQYHSKTNSILKEEKELIDTYQKELSSFTESQTKRKLIESGKNKFNDTSLKKAIKKANSNTINIENKNPTQKSYINDIFPEEENLNGYYK